MEWRAYAFTSIETTTPFLTGKVEPVGITDAVEDDELTALGLALREGTRKLIELLPRVPQEISAKVDAFESPAPSPTSSRTTSTRPSKRRRAPRPSTEGAHPQGAQLLTRQLEILKMRERINSQIKEEMGKNQREYVLRQQLKAIKEELGEDDGDQGDLDGLEERIAKANLPTEAEQVAKKQLKRLRNMQVGSRRSTPSCARTSTGSSTCRGTRRRPTTWTSPRSAQVLDDDHYGLEKVKKRILEYLAVRKLKKDKKGPILCLIGPARRRQDVARPEHRARARPQVRTASRSAACTTRRPSAATGAPTSARSPGRSSRG